MSEANHGADSIDELEMQMEDLAVSHHMIAAHRARASFPILFPRNRPLGYDGGMLLHCYLGSRSEAGQEEFDK